ncbi:hypothetical protein [Tardiphaga sp. 839_C3_N1_4]
MQIEELRTVVEVFGEMQSALRRRQLVTIRSPPTAQLATTSQE